MQQTRPTWRFLALLFFVFAAFNVRSQVCDAKIHYQSDPQNTHKIYFNAEYAAGNTYNWEFQGEGPNGATTQSVEHTYSAAGSYTVKLFVTNGQCSDTAEVNVVAGGPPCKADFNFHSDSADFHKIIFDDASTNGAGLQSFSWDFDNNGTFEGGTTKEDYTYSTTGSKWVCLAIQGPGCIDTVCKDIEVKDHNQQPCSAKFNAIDNGGGTFEFQDSSFSNDGVIDAWAWDFGDNTQATTKNTAHTYTVQDNYTACLEITTTTGCKDMHCDFIQYGNKTCHAEFSWNEQGMNYNFEGHAMNEAAMKSFSWFIDGNNYSSQDVNHTFGAAGTYEVIFAVEHNDGCTDTIKKTVAVNGSTPNCQAQFNYNITNGGMSVDVQDQSNASSGMKSWDYSVGENNYTYNTSNFTHQYSNTGGYTICLAIEANDGCKDTVCHTVEIKDQGEHGGEKIDPIGPCAASAWYEVDSADHKKIYLMSQSGTKGTGPINVQWATSDGGSYTSEEAMHIFTQDGDATVCLMIEADGCRDTACLDIKISAATDCQALFHPIFDPQNPKKVQFVLSGSGNLDGGYWDFGDGTKSEDKFPIYEFSQPGFYQVCVNGMDSASGCQVSNCIPVEIEGAGGNNNCFAEFDIDSVNNLFVGFHNKSQGDFNKIKWEFGDGTISEEVNPNHTFPHAGLYDICLTVFDSVGGCVSHMCKKIPVSDGVSNVCKADFNFFPIGDKKFQFDNSSEGNYTHVKWEFGNGDFVESKDAEFEFPGPGYYNVCLSIFDSVSNCMNTNCKTVEIEDTNTVNCLADFDFFKENNRGVQFHNKSQGAFTNVHWAFGDGGFSDDQNAHHMYNNDGHFEVCVSIKDSASGCFDQMCKKVAIIPDSVQVYCEAKFEGFKDPNGEFKFNNLSTGNITNQYWEFGNGHISHDHSPVFHYNNPGFYTVILTVMDSTNGCVSHFSQDISILPDTNTTACLSKYEFFVEENKLTVKNLSVGEFTNTHWEFGDGSHSTNMDGAEHIYTSTGYYNVCLGIYDTTSQCQDYQCTEIAIVKDTADAYCKAGFKKMVLADGSIHLSNEAQGSFQLVHWDFGNGDFSDDWDVTSEGQVAPGTYHVCMAIMDTINGCQDMYCEDVVVLGNDTAPKCFADFHFFPKSETEVVFENTSLGEFTKVHWEFGDGKFGTSTDDQISHDYPHGGYFQVCLAVYDSATGCQAQICKDIELLLDTTVVDCHAKIEFFPTGGNMVDFKNASKGTFQKTYWEFSNQDVSYDHAPVVDFNNSGLHHACLTIKDTVSGCMDKACIEIPLIDTNTAYCNAHFEYMIDEKEVFLKPNIIGHITGWIWEFQDGYVSHDTMPVHQFEKPGFYDVCLTVFDSTTNCFDTYCEYIEVIGDTSAQDDFCNARFSYFVTPNSNTVEFVDESHGNIDSWYWNFGDNDSAGVTQNPIYTYAENGYYEVNLTVKTANGCQEHINQVIAVGDVSKSCFAKFNYFADSVTSTAHFNNKSIGNITDYAWDFGDSLTSVQFQPSHSYADTGFYPVCLTVSNTEGCERTFCKEVRVGNALSNPCIIGCVWPGDANSDLEANHYDILPIGLHFGETGPVREDASNTWYGQKAEDWSVSLWGTVNNKHNDCDGDGVIGLSDLEVLKDNFAYSHPWQPKAAGKQLNIDWDVEDIEVGETATLIVSLADSSAATMYGLGFEINLDPNVFDYSTLTYDFSNSWLGTTGSDLITFEYSDSNLGNVYIAESRNDHTELTGSGELVRISVVAKATSNGAETTTLTTEGGVDASGDTVNFNGQSVNAEVNSIDERQGFLMKELLVFPNPSTGEVNFNLPTGTSVNYTIEVRDNVGRVVYTDQVNQGGLVKANLNDLGSGIYNIQVASDKVKYLQKIVINK